MKSHWSRPGFLIVLCAVAFLSGARGLHAAPVISDSFLRLSEGETLSAPFSAPVGTPTIEKYKGLVELIVSGTGYSFGLNENDAFYCSLAADSRCPGPGTILDPEFYQLNIGMLDLPFAGGEANNINQFIVFIENLGPVIPGTLPAYDAVGHTYHFVLDLPIAIPSRLHFGVSDGIYTDNGGSFEIRIFQLAGATVPEPGILWLVLLGASVMGVLRVYRS